LSNPYPVNTANATSYSLFSQHPNAWFSALNTLPKNAPIST
jgi:hypothetical protein